MAQDPQIMCHIDVFAARDRMIAMAVGRETPPLPMRIPELFQISKAAPTENGTLPEGLNKKRKERRHLLQER